MQRPVLHLPRSIMTVQTAREKLAQINAEAKELAAKKNAIRVTPPPELPDLGDTII